MNSVVSSTGNIHVSCGYNDRVCSCYANSQTGIILLSNFGQQVCTFYSLTKGSLVHTRVQRERKREENWRKLSSTEWVKRNKQKWIQININELSTETERVIKIFIELNVEMNLEIEWINIIYWNTCESHKYS